MARLSPAYHSNQLQPPGTAASSNLTTYFYKEAGSNQALSSGQMGSGYHLDLSQEHVMQALNERANSSRAESQSAAAQDSQPSQHSSGRKLSYTSDFWKQQQRHSKPQQQAGHQTVYIYSGNYDSPLPDVPGAKVEALAAGGAPAWQHPPNHLQTQHAPNRLAAGMASLAVSGGRSEFPLVPTEPVLVKVMLVWNGSGSAQSVSVKGSFDGWQTARRMQQQSDKSWGIAAYLPPGIYQYKYVVDGVWRYDPWAPVVRDESGNLNNVIEVVDPCTSFDIPSDFDVPPSPTASYGQDLPPPGETFAEPPPLPPQASLTPLDIPTAAAPLGWPEADASMAVHPAEHAVLNHIWTAAPTRRSSEHRGPLVIGTSFRFRAKHVVALMYKPRATRSGDPSSRGERRGNSADFADFNR